VLTLLAFDVPSMLDMSGQYQKLFMPILAYCLTGLIVILYWFKLRQLIEFSRVLTLMQLVLIFLGLLTVVLLPKMTELALNYGGKSGSVFNWTLSQAVNFNFLAALFIVDLLILLFVLSLRRQSLFTKSVKDEIEISFRAQMVGFLLIFVLALMVLFLPWFNDEFIVVLPIILLLEEFLVAQQFSRGFVMRSCHRPATSVQPGQKI
jgi:uncharacterized membrane protein